MNRRLSILVLALVSFAAPLFAAPGLLYPLDRKLADGASHRVVVSVQLDGKVLAQETYVFTLASPAALPLRLQGATREIIESLEREHPLAMRVVVTIDGAAKELTFPRLLQQDALARARSLAPVAEYVIEPRRGNVPHEAPKDPPNAPMRIVTNTESMCPNSSYCMDDYWDCKGGHGDNENNEYCDFELQRCQFGEHVTRNVRTNNQYSLFGAVPVCAHDGFWEAFNAHIYLMGSHSYTDQVWDDWYCGGSLVSSTLVSSTNGSETCWYKTEETCGMGGEDISGECTFP
jgi:hypothetical protein